MDEKTQILYMQTRLVRLAAEKWNMTIQKANTLFERYDVFHYIADLFGLFHVEGDDAVLEDVEQYISEKGSVE